MYNIYDVPRSLRDVSEPRMLKIGRLPFPAPGDLPDPGTEPTSPVSPVLVVGFFTTEPPGKPHLD